MTKIWQNFSVHRQRLLIIMVMLMSIVVIGMQFHVSSQGICQKLIPRVFVVVPVRSHPIHCWSAIQLILFPMITRYRLMRWARCPFRSVCGKVPSPGLLSITIDLLHPISMREQHVALSLFKKPMECQSRNCCRFPPKIINPALFIRTSTSMN